MTPILLALLAAGPVQVRVSPALAPCVQPALEALARESASSFAITSAAPGAAGEADVVIADDSELTRVLEGGRGVLATAVDLGIVREGMMATAAGERRRTGLAPLMVSAVEMAGARNPAGARGVLALLRTPAARARMARCVSAAAAPKAGLDVYGRAIVDWWIPQCSLDRNAYDDVNQALGAPDAANLGGPDLYRGLVSLGQGGYVVLELGEVAVDGPGDDIRVYQSASNEPVSLYVSSSASGPFTLVGLRRACGIRTPGVFSNHCNFDLRGTGVASARFVKIEDGEIYPCLAGGTLSEGADIDSVQTLNR
jgi:hypothetical protein